MFCTLSAYLLYVTLCIPFIDLFPCMSGIFMSTCNVDVRWFPFDIQKCEMKFGSWTYDGWLMDLQMNEADISGYMSNGEWDLVGQWGWNCPPKFLLSISQLHCQLNLNFY